jgi:hypothetical protein
MGVCFINSLIFGPDWWSLVGSLGGLFGGLLEFFSSAGYVQALSLTYHLAVPVVRLNFLQSLRKKETDSVRFLQLVP